MMDLRRLRLLREVASWGTITAAAEASHLTPSGVSQHLTLLEREVGVPLFHRDGRRLRLTDAAERLVTHTERILAEMESAEAAVASLSDTVSGSLRLAAFPTAARALAPSAMAACRLDYPALRIALEEREADESVTALRQRQIDMAIIYEYNVLPPMEDPGVELIPLLDEPILATLPPDSPAPKPGEPVALTMLRDQPWIAPEDDSACWAAIERACAFAGFTPHLEHTSNDFTVIHALVHAGLGVTLMPQLAVEPLATETSMHPIAEFPLRRHLSIAVRRGANNHPAIAALTHALVDVARRTADDLMSRIREGL
ncbi:MAG: LysR family transcriptional regulator [Carbonactinosporaceae bacterium]